MLVVLSTCHRDAPLALANAEWIASLGGSSEHKWIVACNQALGRTDFPQRIADALRKKYVHVEVLVHYDEDERQWPYAQNHAFQRSAQYVAGKYNTPWLWLECDAIPLCDGWLEKIEAEYQKSAKPFMGFLVDVCQVNGQQIPLHMSGVAVYPGEVAAHSIQAMRCTGLAFDMAGAEEILPKFHNTRLLFHKYQCPSIDSWERFDSIIPKEAVLMHQQKSPDIIELMKRRRVGIEEAIDVRAEFQTIITSSGLPFTCDIFIKTRAHDYDWLKYCLRSIDQFATGFRKVIVLAEDMNVPASCRHMEWKVVEVKEPGYLDQQVQKLYADEHSDADYILFTDSDCIFTQPVTPSSFMRDGKVSWGHKEFRDDELRVWAPVISKWMKEPATRSFMTGHPFVFPHWLFEALREFCRTAHNQKLGDYVMAQADPKNMCSFSEFNCAGAFAFKYHRDKFNWENRDHEPPDGVWVRQGFTHGGEKRKAQDLTEFERILSTTFKETFTIDTLKTKDFSVKELVNELAEYCKKDGFAKGRVIRQLQIAGIVPAKKKK